MAIHITGHLILRLSVKEKDVEEVCMGGKHDHWVEQGRCTLLMMVDCWR